MYEPCKINLHFKIIDVKNSQEYWIIWIKPRRGQIRDFPCDLETAGASNLNQKYTGLNDWYLRNTPSFSVALWSTIETEDSSFPQTLISNFSVKGENTPCHLIFYSNHQAKTTVERCNHTPVGPLPCDGPKVRLVGLDTSQNQILLGIGCFSKITTKKYVERLIAKLCKYGSFLIWQKWTLCEERRTTRIVTLIHVVNAFSFH